MAQIQYKYDDKPSNKNYFYEKMLSRSASPKEQYKKILI